MIKTFKKCVCCLVLYVHKNSYACGLLLVWTWRVQICMTTSNKPSTIIMEPNENLANIGIYLQVFISNFIRTHETKGIWPIAIIHYPLSTVVCCPLLFLFLKNYSMVIPWPFKWCISDDVLFLLIKYIQCHLSYSAIFKILTWIPV